MIKKLFTAFYANENILYFDKDFGNVIFNYKEMGILNTDPNCINLDDNNFDEDDSGILFMSDFWLGIRNLKNVKHLKKESNEELMPVAWHPNRWWDCCLSEDEKKEIDPVLIEGIIKV